MTDPIFILGTRARMVSYVARGTVEPEENVPATLVEDLAKAVIS